MWRPRFPAEPPAEPPAEQEKVPRAIAPKAAPVYEKLLDDDKLRLTRESSWVKAEGYRRMRVETNAQVSLLFEAFKTLPESGAHVGDGPDEKDALPFTDKTIAIVTFKDGDTE